MNTWKILTTVLFAISLLGTVQNANAEKKVKLGTLECIVNPGLGFIIGSLKRVSCIFTPLSGEDQQEERYIGKISILGIDIGGTDESKLSWLVIAPSNTEYKHGVLAGEYVGASANAALAVGLGGNVLVGGSDKSFALQPLSINTLSGVNLAVGLGELSLKFKGKIPCCIEIIEERKQNKKQRESP